MLEPRYGGTGVPVGETTGAAPTPNTTKTKLLPTTAQLPSTLASKVIDVNSPRCEDRISNPEKPSLSVSPSTHSRDDQASPLARSENDQKL